MRGPAAEDGRVGELAFVGRLELLAIQFEDVLLEELCQLIDGDEPIRLVAFLVGLAADPL